MEPYWTTTNGTWTLYRNETSIVKWHCIGEFMLENITDTSSGTLLCQKNGTVLQWNDTISLPCNIHCPDKFHPSYDEERCYYFSDTNVTGLHQAAVKCLELNASVAMLVDGMDLTPAAPNVKYYTSHSTMGRSMTYPVLNLTMANINCTDGNSCNLMGTNKCLAAQQGGNAYPVTCNSPLHYACQRPAYCPDGYKKVDGACYLPITTSSVTLEAAESACNANGSSLAYPNSASVLSRLVTALKDTGSSGTQPFFLGINSRTGDYTAGGLYPDAVGWGGNASPYVALALPSGNTTSVALINDTAGGGGVCQWPGVIGCYFPSPIPTANMTATANFTTANFSDSIVYTCDRGFFVNGSVSLSVNQTLHCLGALGGWQPPLLPCIRVPVCANAFPNVTNAGMKNITDANSVFLDGNVTYTCPTGMGIAGTGDANQTLTCSQDATNSTSYIFQPAFQECLACSGAPVVLNATTDYANTTAYVYNASLVTNAALTPKEFVTATCVDGFEAKFNVTTQNISCTMNNWNMTSILPCKKACRYMPPAAGANLTMSPITERWVGTQVTYTCDPRTYLEPNGTLLMASNVTATCSATGDWTIPRGTLDCYLLATNQPPAAPPNMTTMTTTWKGDGTDNLREGATVNYTCPAGQVFGNRMTTVTSTSVNGSWTAINSSILICSRACLDPPAEINGVNVTWSGLPTFVEEVLTYQCPKGQATDYGAFNESIKCMDTAGNATYGPVNQAFNMTTLQEKFVCRPACPGPPLDAPLHANSSFTGNFTEGVVVEYFCPGYFQSGQLALYNNCTNGNWSMIYVPDCGKLEIHDVI
ncbi:uncharacterized protein LOC108677955 [Hyalella azteca]|uniref:Uncharacterized protein LOC108677955 n=1 Tax=Hyalella azteca TaxID=294128 RepID=A0A8B7P6T9_HYAAZ|nr:uncharacterized protein LOC108677955 [Hyalella azteca]